MTAHATGGRRGARMLILSRTAGALLAIPAFLALGVAGAAVFVVGVSALVLAPRLRALGGRATARSGRTITLDPSSYRRVDDAADRAHPAATDAPRLGPQRFRQ